MIRKTKNFKRIFFILLPPLIMYVGLQYLVLSKNEQALILNNTSIHKLEQPTRIDSQEVKIEHLVITQVSPKKGWVTYTNNNYKYKIDVPLGSTLQEEDYDLNIALYTRIQNYSVDKDKDYALLNLGEYNLEIITYDSNLGHSPAYPCKEWLTKPIEFILDGTVAYKGALLGSGGESAKSIYGLCVERESVTFYLTVGEDKDVEIVSKEIVDSFRFLTN